MTDKDPVPSPSATGGAGEHFEQHVDAFALALLLVGATPPILVNTSVVEVCFQTRHLGWQTDDLLIVGDTGAGCRRKLAAQVKRSFTVAAADSECRATFAAFWDDFQASDRFDRAEDRFAVVTLHGTATLLQTFNSLLDCARASVDAADFGRRLALEGYLSRKSKRQNDAIRELLTAHIGAPPDDDTYFLFLRAINVVSLDLNTSTAQNEAAILSLLAYSATDAPDPLGAARLTWSRLLECVGIGRPSAATYRRESLPRELLDRHREIPSGDSKALRAVVEHGELVRQSIRSVIGEKFEIDRSALLDSFSEALDGHQVLMITGAPGSGKSALAKALLARIESTRPVLAFQAVEFAKAHLNETLADSQTTLSAQALVAMLAGQDRTTILVESLERLLEHSVRDAFAQLLQLIRSRRSVQLVVTCRHYSVETVRSSFIATSGLQCRVRNVPALSDEEIRKVQDGIPGLEAPLDDPQLRSFLRTPYLLDIASRLSWEEGRTPKSAAAFRRKCWRELIRAEQLDAEGMPDRREKAFVDIAQRRATELRPYVRPSENDAAALSALAQNSLIARSPQAIELFAPSHDVLEDWAIIHWLETQFETADDPALGLATAVGGFPALRRGFRRWLGERFDLQPNNARDFVLDAIARRDVPAYFRDDCLVSALLSDSAGAFVSGCAEIVDGGETGLLTQIIHMLRVACKESPRWLNIPGLPSRMLVPTGPGWAPTLGLVAARVDRLVSENASLILGLVEDWGQQVHWKQTCPEGFEDAGRIVSRLLQQFEGRGSNDALKRTLEVLLKIPQAVPEFGQLMVRAQRPNYRDRVANGLAELVLGSISGTYACRDYPVEVIALANARLRISDDDLQKEFPTSAMGVNEVFGIREYGVSSCFPASGLQGPFAALLRSHAQLGVNFIIDLLNHAGYWYGTQKWPGQRLEAAVEITVDVPDTGPVQQWMNSRLYGLYRGISVGPYELQSALMALESWLLGMAEFEGVDLEAWLLFVLRNSDNVMATAVVASVCIAHPDKAGKAGLALLSSRELIECDRIRLVSEASHSFEIGFGLRPANHLYEEERKQSNSLKHRGDDLESLAIRMQLSGREEDVWGVIDRHRSELPADSSEATLVWRLALHRMDLRDYQPTTSAAATPEAGDDTRGAVLLGPGKIEPDVQNMVDESSKSQAVTDRYVALLNRALSAWSNKASEDSGKWVELLREAQAIDHELSEPVEFVRGGPGLIAAVCIRDRFDELDADDLDWCAQRVEAEVHRDSQVLDETVRVAQTARKPDRACASVVPILVARGRLPLKLLAIAVTHPVDQVREYAFDGTGLFLGESQKQLVLLCAAAAAHQARLLAAARREEEKLPRIERTYGWSLVDRTIPAVRNAIERRRLDVAREIEALDFDDWASSIAIRSLLSVFEQHSGWEEARNFFSKVAVWLADTWEQDERASRRGAHDFELQYEASRILARFVLTLPVQVARRICAPIVEAVDRSAREVADFVENLILAADASAEADCFWPLWQDFADKVAPAPWSASLDRESPYEAPFIDAIFLRTYWKEGVKHWERLNGHAQRVERLAEQLPATTCCLEAFSRFLYSIGQQSLPDAFKVVASVLERGDATLMASNANIAFHLETRLQRFVYTEPQRLKSEPTLRNAVLEILDALISAGSSSAYRMRDDFVTPLQRT